MKKLFFAFALISALFSCKKENTQNPETNTSKAGISDFDFTTVKVSSLVTKNQAVVNVTAEISYKGGNGKYYLEKTYASTGVIGLTALLPAGYLEEGNGVLTFTIYGTPTSSGKANFMIDLGNKSGVLSVDVLDINQVVGKESSVIKDVDGNLYKTVTIGSQTWMAENLKTSKYNDGTTIINITEDYQWKELTSGAWVFYKNDSSNYCQYGKLYNWYTLNPTSNGNKNVCPIGWRVPSEVDWKNLIAYLGGQGVAGGKLKQVGISHWNNPNTDALNTSLFNAIPGGIRKSDGTFEKNGDFGFWWSSSEVFNESAWLNKLSTTDAISEVDFNNKKSGVSIRCIKD